jgi:anti-repressor protein
MAKDLIKIEMTEGNEQVVSGRELHEFLGIKSNYTTWFQRMCGYGFVENEDYITWFPNLESENHGGQNKADNYMALDMAKEICMIQRSQKGKQAREYFV